MHPLIERFVEIVECARVDPDDCAFSAPEDDTLADIIRQAQALDADPATPLAWPLIPTPEILDALGHMAWNTGPIAGAFREAGYQIERNAEAEQAFVLAFFVGEVLRHGKQWKIEVAMRLLTIRDQAKKGPGNGAL